MVFVLSDQHSIASQFLAELRDTTIQTDRLRFRRNMERLGSIMAYEISKKLTYRQKEIETPLAKVKATVPQAPPVLITILRAGLTYYQGFQYFFDQSDAGFIGAYRKEGEKELTIKLDYVATPSLEGKEVILIDPMLATGRSVMDAIAAFTKNGRPSHIYIASLVAAPEGIAYLQNKLNIPFSIWTVAVDEKLNSKFYIVPGLGDAGDLSFGDKL